MGKQLAKPGDWVVDRYKITGPFIGEGSFSEARLRLRSCVLRSVVDGADVAPSRQQVYPADDKDTHLQVRYCCVRKARCTCGCTHARMHVHA
jgi:hypothetical protein